MVYGEQAQKMDRMVISKYANVPLLIWNIDPTAQLWSELTTVLCGIRLF